MIIYVVLLKSVNVVKAMNYVNYEWLLANRIVDMGNPVRPRRVRDTGVPTHPQRKPKRRGNGLVFVVCKALEVVFGRVIGGV